MMNTRIDIISSPSALDGKEGVYVFLAGPIQGASDWQHNIPKIPGVTWISPRRESYANFDYDEQTDWETVGLRISDVILMWIPEPEKEIQGRSYAQTTRIEFGEILGRNHKKLILGIYDNFPGRKYFKNKLEEYGHNEQEIHSTLEGCIKELEEWLVEQKKDSTTWFTSDTHFGSSRTLTLSKRPFNSVNDMNWTLVERWNSTVKPWDTVYHLGDFGDPSFSSYLNGKIKFLKGNYERAGKSPCPTAVDEILGEEVIELPDYILCHEPLKGLGYRDEKGINKPILFGHIHCRQIVKSWKGVDVGVDGHDYRPISKEEIDWWLSAIDRYYDDDVWC